MFRATKTAISLLIRKLKKQRLRLQYIRAYKNMPETEDEIISAYNSAVEALADEPWK